MVVKPQWSTLPLTKQNSDLLSCGFLTLSWAFSNVMISMPCENYYLGVAQLGEWIISNQFLHEERALLIPG